MDYHSSRYLYHHEKTTTVTSDKSRHQGIFGIHPVTAVTGNVQKNIDFYANILGLRLVKLTVNQDDPTSYHIYYGDELGRPGTLLTFFIGQIFLKDIAELVRLLPHPFQLLKIR